MKKLFKKIGRELFAFLSSLQLAVVLLFSFGVILAVGTYYESSYDADTAKHYVYGTWWFVGFLALLGTNVFCAALSRYPWKRHHTGFLVVHLGIILILIGSSVTLMKGYEGQLIVKEGEVRDRILLKEPYLYFFEMESGQGQEIPAPFRFSPPSSQKPFGAKIFGDILVKIDDYLPHAHSEDRVESSEGPNDPALQIQLQGSRAQLKEWVFARHFDRQRLGLGPASVTFVEVPDPRTLQKIIDQKVFRGPVLWAEGQLFAIKGKLGLELPLGKKILMMENFFPHASVSRGILHNLSSEPINPIAKVLIREGAREERHTVAARFPELPTVHDPAFSTSVHLRLIWVPEELGEQENELILAKTDEGYLFYSLKHRGIWGPVQSLRLNQEVATGWMDFKFSVLKALEKARVVTEYRRAIVPPKQEGPPPALHLALAEGGNYQEIWLGRGESREIPLGNRRLKVAYGLRTLPLGFQVRLKDFHLGTYEGTQDPASFESLVTVVDQGQEVNQDYRIAMNEPLKHSRYKIFQASYQLDPGGKDWSILAVAYDPGIYLKYIGAVVLVTGIILIFFFRPMFLRKNALSLRAKRSNPVASLGHVEIASSLRSSQ